MSKEKRINVRIDWLQWAKLKKHLENNNKTVSQWMRDRIDLMRTK